MKKNLKKISLLLSMSILFTNCSQYEYDYIESHSEMMRVDYSGEEMYRGIFFLQNEISENIPQLYEIKLALDKMEYIKQSYEELSDITVDYIKMKYPMFFTEFKQVLMSGDLYKISEIMDIGARLIEQSALASNKYKQAFLLGVDIQTDEELRRYISQIDLTTQLGIEELDKIVSERTNISQHEVSAMAGVTALAYAFVGAISIAIVVYSVYYKVAYWGPRAKKGPDSIESPFKIGNNTVNIEHEILISDLASYFKQI